MRWASRMRANPAMICSCWRKRSSYSSAMVHVLSSALSALFLEVKKVIMPSESIPCYQTECPMNKKYIVRLSDEERGQLTELTRKGQAAAYKIRHAHILLKADADGPSWTDERIAESFSVSVNTG